MFSPGVKYSYVVYIGAHMQGRAKQKHRMWYVPAHGLTLSYG
jgi:hypothetical protein